MGTSGHIKMSYTNHPFLLAVLALVLTLGRAEEEEDKDGTKVAERDSELLLLLLLLFSNSAVSSVVDSPLCMFGVIVTCVVWMLQELKWLVHKI